MARRIPRQSLAAILLFALALASRSAEPALTQEQQAVLAHISADSLRGNLSFLASDLLEGRGTPSRGLDLAAEYLAAQFRRAGLEPAGDDGYFQTATVTVREPDYDGFECTIRANGRTLPLGRDDIFLSLSEPLQLENEPLVIADADPNLAPADVNGKILLVLNPRGARRLQGAQPKLLLDAAARLPGAGMQVFAPESSAPLGASGVIAHPALASFVRGAADVRITLHSQPGRERKEKVRNVAAILRGSDLKLRDTFVMLTSHYDHLGLATTGEDRVYNGANDDGSGTASVVEIAAALAAMPVHPARSVLFVLFFGEEPGLWGSRYYARHPLVPPASTIADVNLEQVGRTDSYDGRQIRTASITGFDFSDLPKILEQEAELAGVRVYKNPQASDAFFARSDNQSLAELGIPAHTLCVAFNFPDYHKVSDNWEKIDYANMAAVDRAVALGILHLASDVPPPQWNESYQASQKYAEAAHKLHTEK
jgi:hypothetical protein